MRTLLVNLIPMCFRALDIQWFILLMVSIVLLILLALAVLVLPRRFHTQTPLRMLCLIAIPIRTARMWVEANQAPTLVALRQLSQSLSSIPLWFPILMALNHPLQNSSELLLQRDGTR